MAKNNISLATADNQSEFFAGPNRATIKAEVRKEHPGLGDRQNLSNNKRRLPRHLYLMQVSDETSHDNFHPPDAQNTHPCKTQFEMIADFADFTKLRIIRCCFKADSEQNQEKRDEMGERECSSVHIHLTLLASSFLW